MALPNRYQHLDPAAKQVLAQPTTRVLNAAAHDPDMANNLTTLHRQAVGEQLKGQMVHAINTGQSVDPDLAKRAQAAGVTSAMLANPLSWGSKLGTEVANTAVGFGPGVAHAAIAGFHHPIGETEALGKAMGQSIGRTYTHPIRNFQNDPLEFLTNTFGLAAAGAGTAARASELARAGELADAAGISKGSQVLKTLIRPQTPMRQVNVGGEQGLAVRGMPAYKSAIGGMLQTKVLDPLLERGYTRQVARQASGAAEKGLEAPGAVTKFVSPAARIGRMIRKDMENDVRIRAGSLSGTAMPNERAVDLARGTAFHDRWKGLYDGALQGHELGDNPKDMVPIKPPPDVPAKDALHLTDAELEQHPTLKMTANQLVNNLDTRSRVASKFLADNKYEAANPESVRYLPKQLIDSMKPYSMESARGQQVLNTVDRGNQLIRSGRFLSPAYANWAVQNGIIGASQQGPLMLRNLYQLAHVFPKLSGKLQGAIDGGVGKGVARATLGSEEGAAARATYGQGYLGRQVSKLPGGAKGIQKFQQLPQFWHKLDDQWARRMSAIHELNRAGYHSANQWESLLTKRPDEFRSIMQQANREAIDYTEMTPAEKATFAKLFTAYGWTRGASTFSGRFALQHPVQARVGYQTSQQGQQAVGQYYHNLGGMAPTWLQSYLPLGGGKLLSTDVLNPAGTPGRILQELPGATKGQTEALSGELGPVSQAALEFLTGRNTYGTAYRGSQRLTSPIGEMLNRYRPMDVWNLLTRSKLGGTFTQGGAAAAGRFLGSPVSQLRNPKQTAALGERDYEQALSPQDKINFQLNNNVSNFRSQVAAYNKANPQSPITRKDIGSYIGDYHAVAQRDSFQLNYANQHGSKTWKALSATDKLYGTIQWLQAHGTPRSELASLVNFPHQAMNDQEIESIVNTLWQGTGIGQYASSWKSLQKDLAPPTKTPPVSPPPNLPTNLRVAYQNSMAARHPAALPPAPPAAAPPASAPPANLPPNLRAAYGH
jgi:hypothetical protein